MNEQLKNILIGIFVTAALIVGVSMVVFLKPKVGDGKQKLYVRFANVSGLGIGTRVTFGGKMVGEVNSIEEVPNAREIHVDGSNKVYLYELGIKLDSSVKLYDSDEITIRSSGLMGEKSIAIIPKLSLHGKESKPLSSETVYASSGDPMETAISQMGKLALRFQVLVEHFDQWFCSNKEHLNYTISNISSFSESLDKVGKSLTTGKGSIGKFLFDEDFYLRLSSITGKVETLMHDINHYGILFQYDKSWQRNRLKRENELNSLENPQAFKEYFEGEMAEIQSSLSRISQLIQNAKDSKGNSNTTNSDEFKRDFAFLLRQVKSLQETLYLYNETLVVPNLSSSP
jgi:phospholipid/cholesterol/gamma-HCH transport system substrate-binding protein